MNMAQKVIVYRTDEITDELWAKIVDGFSESFGLHADAEGFKHGWYVSNPWGYAFHAVALTDDDELMAYNVFTPLQYDNGIKVVVSGSTFVRQKFRKNIMLFASMIKALRKRCADEGFDIEVGVPNHNSLEYHLKINKVTWVKDLPYYVLPITLSRTMGKRLPGFVDKLWRLALKVHLWVNALLSSIANNKERRRAFSMSVDEPSYSTRFSGREYKSVNEGGHRFVYRVYHEEGKDVAYLMDYRTGDEKTYSSLVKACRYIAAHENVDAVLYVGFMHLAQCLMAKLPDRMVPKRLPLTCYVLNKDGKSRFDGIANPDNWNFSLMGFDVR